MNVQWVRPSRNVQWVGRVPNTLGASASVTTSGIVPTLLFVGVLGLAVYGAITAIGKLPAGR